MNGLLGALPPGLAGFAMQRQMAGQEQNQQMAQMRGLLGIKASLDQNAMNAQMKPLQMELLQAQIAEKNAAVQGAAQQRQAQGALSQLMGTGGYTGPTIAPTSVAQNDTDALRMVQEADAKGIPMGVNVPNPQNVRALTSMAFPQQYGQAAATAMFRDPKVEPVSPVMRMMRDRDRLPIGDPGRAALDAAIAKAGSHAPAPTAMVKVDNYTPASEEAQKDFMKSTRVTYDSLKQAPAVLENIEKIKKLIPKASGFMGTGGEPLLDGVKFLNNRLGLGIATEGVKSAEELRSRTFFQILDNLKKMDAAPSQQQQAVMRDALGQLGTDPSALGNILDAFGDVIRTKVQLHNREVTGAEQRGVKFPYSPIIDLRAGGSGNGAAPAAGTVRDGYRFKGGNPADRNSWEKI